MASNDALRRKQRSEAILREEGVPILANLPTVEDESSVRFRSLEEVAWRTMALNVVAVKGEGLDQTRVLEIVEQYQLAARFTPKETKFIFDSSPTDHQRIQFSWRYEAYWVLLWALNYVEKLERPDAVCDVERGVQIMVDRTSIAFIAEAKLRTAVEILDATDLIYRYDWACVDARLNDRIIPAGLNPSVVAERHPPPAGGRGRLSDVSTDT
ncbi:MAG: DUF4272 domain-containing protein [Chloracidobacterium sp.]|nr:DUF4272 domain-containing protein [Chloracidobacterium sp.]